MDNEGLLDDVVRILRDCGLNAGVSDTGGGILCIAIASPDGDLGEPRFVFGTAGETWAAEVLGEPDGLTTIVTSEEPRPAVVAGGILAALSRLASPSE